jgi:integrase
VRPFLIQLVDGRRSLEAISVSDVDSLLAQKVNEEHYARVSVRDYASSLRPFFRYAEMRGWCVVGIATSIMAPRVFQQETLPSGPTWDIVQEIVDATAGDHPIAIRDHAILMLLAIYGVRSGEVARLQLTDIDWQRETITFTRSKMAGSHSFPLRPSVGAAIIRYLKEVRPKSPHRQVFLTRRAPVGPLSGGAMWAVVSRQLRKRAPSLRHHGPHSLRHACATRLINLLAPRALHEWRSFLSAAKFRLDFLRFRSRKVRIANNIYRTPRILFLQDCSQRREPDRFASLVRAIGIIP